MSSDEELLWEVRISMPEIEHSDFIRERRAKLQSALLEAKNDQESGRGAKPFIQRVPAYLIDIKEDFKKYFEPRWVAIGPFHNRNPKFEQGEHTKLKLAALFAEENETTDAVLFNEIKKEIKDLRTCYNPEDIKDYDDDELAWMFFVDGSAVLYAVHYGLLRGEFQKLNIKAELVVLMALDFFLLENQLPYQVLKILIRLAKEPREWEKSITEFIRYSVITYTRDGKSQNPAEEEEEQEFTHLLERLRTKHLTGEREWSSSSMIGHLLLSGGDNRKHVKTIRRIKDLKEIGISVRPSESENLKNISFYCNLRGTLKMPCILVDDSTATKFLNLLALEMCRDFENDLAITSFLCFLGSLIDTAEDVKELRLTGILHSYLGSDEEVAELFCRMSRDLVPDLAIYYDVADRIHRYYNSRVMWIYSNYFGSNWSFLAFLGAVIGLSLTVTQTYFSAKTK
ncbi:Protein of unknown function DUF247 [Theobroma cacao]|nr:Protein of unknown function DUF247 [Theobroma cacao]